MSLPSSALARPDPSRHVAAALEAVVLIVVAVSPWAVGSVEPAFEAAVYAGVALVVLLWGLRGLMGGPVSWCTCPVVCCLAGLFLFGAAQLVPLPRPALEALSPTAARLYGELLPTTRETLTPSDPIPAAAWPAGSSLSLYPGATRGELVRLLAAFLLFAGVRSNLGSVGSLRRLAAVALANAALLSVFALVQRFSSPPNTLFWTYKAPNDPFGPFICRNHFPFYVNMAIGLGVGLFLERRRGVAVPWWQPSGLLADPVSAWVALGLALCGLGVAFSLSRGGALALAGGCVVAVALGSPRRSVPARAAAGLLAAAAVLVGLACAGPAALRARLATVWQGEAMQDGRVGLWSDALEAVRDFPVCGTGYGTFVHVEPMYRTGSTGSYWVFEHAHNDYLEALVEGGAVCLLLTLGAVVAVGWCGGRVLRRYAGRPGGALVLGALFAFTTIVLHSAVDFGLHLPAVAVLAVVLCAHLSALGAGEATAPAPRGAGRAAVAALLAAALAVVLCAEGWRMAQAQSLRLGAYAVGAGDDPARIAERLALLEAAARLTPERAEAHLEAARAYHAAATLPGVGGPLGEQRLRAAAAHYVLARDLCPVSARAHLCLATCAGALRSPDPRSAYLRRAKRLYGFDPELYYLAGALELADGESELALQSWRHSLELSDAFLGPMVQRGRGVLTDEDWLTRVLPRRPALLLAAALQLHAGDELARREPYLREALRQLDEAAAPGSAADLHLAGVLHEALGEPAEAATAYEAALVREPRRAEWRYDLARLLDRQGDAEGARRQLRVVLTEAPDHAEAHDLFDAIQQRLTKRPSPSPE